MRTVLCLLMALPLALAIEAPATASTPLSTCHAGRSVPFADIKSYGGITCREARSVVKIYYRNGMPKRVFGLKCRILKSSGFGSTVRCAKGSRWVSFSTTT